MADDTGSKLGRPFKDTGKNRERRREQKRIEREDGQTRMAVEGKFGGANRRYTLDRIGTEASGNE